MTRWYSKAGLLVALVAGLTGCPEPPEVVPSVDLDRYTGLWYQVAGYPFFATRDLVAITAEYTANEDGTIAVVNRGRVGDFDGPEDVIEGVATVEDETTNAKLSVSFPSVFFGLAKGEYWIIDLDGENYTYAVVSDSRKATLFILSRTPQMDDAALTAILDGLEARGYTRDRIELTPQPPA